MTLSHEPTSTRNPRAHVDLFVCLTPLHLLIAEFIWTLERINDPVLVYINDSANEKDKYYFSWAASKSSYAIHLQRTSSSAVNALRLLRAYWRIRSHSAPPTSLRLFTGNLKKPTVRHLVFMLKPADLNTFDDGIGNLFLDSYFSDMSESSKLLGLASQVFPRLSYRHLVRSINCHYTIYDAPNIYDGHARQKRRVTPFSRSHLETPRAQTPESEMRLLLTGPFSERGLLTIERELALYARAIKKLQIKHRLPHPAEATTKSLPAECITIETPKIAEDYIFDISKTRDVSVFGFYSTVLANIAGIPGVTAFCLVDRDLAWGSTDIFEKLGVACMHL